MPSKTISAICKNNELNGSFISSCSQLSPSKLSFRSNSVIPQVFDCIVSNRSIHLNLTLIRSFSIKQSVPPSHIHPPSPINVLSPSNPLQRPRHWLRCRLKNNQARRKSRSDCCYNREGPDGRHVLESWVHSE